MLYVYGAVEAGRALPPLTGLDGAAVELIARVELGIAVSGHAEADVKPTRRRLQEHNAVNLALVRGGGVVPFRFGNTFADVEDLGRKLEPREAALREQVGLLAGCAELTLRLKSAEQAPVTAVGEGLREGTAYLLRKRQRLQDEDRLREQAAALRAEMGDAVRDFREDVRDGALRLACLVPLDQAPRLIEQYGMSGPWPPSSFV